MRFLAKEKLSEHKYKTSEGYLVCVDAVLSRTGKQQYRRGELFGDSCERADDMIDVDRLEVDVFDEKAMASFENKPICVEHPDEDVNVANHNELAVGFVRDIKRGIDNGQPVMLGTLVITDENAIDLIESGEYTELSCGYDCDIVDDEHPAQKNIRGNHVALCQHGRAGIARIVDSTNDDLYGLIKEPVKRYYLAKKYDKKWDIEDNIVIIAKNISEAEQKLKLRFPDAYNLREISYSDYLKFKHGNIVIDSIDDVKVTDDDVEWLRALDRYNIKFDFINGGYSMRFKSNADYALAKKLAIQYRMKHGYWDDKALTYSDYRSTTISQEDSVKTNDGGIKVWQVHQVASGPARVINMNDERLIKRTELNVGMNIRWKHRGEQYEGRIKRVEQKGSYTKIDYEDKRGIGASFAFENEPITTDSWTEVEEENYKKANKPIGAKDEEYVQLPRGRFKLVAKTKEELENEGYGYHHSDNGYSVYVKNNSAVAIKDAETDFARFTKQGYPIVSTWRDGGRTHIICKRPGGDFVIGLGYDVATGEWAQGRYDFKTVQAAKSALVAEKPHAHAADSKVQTKDSIYTVKYKAGDTMYIRKIRAKSFDEAISKVKDEVSTAHKVVVFTQNILSEMGKNNSIGKYDKVVSAMRQLYGQSLLPDDKLKEVIRRELPRIITKYGLQDMKDVYNRYEHETDKEFLKSAISEMRRYISNWSFITAREKRNIAPNGFGSLKQDLAFAEKRLAELK